MGVFKWIGVAIGTTVAVVTAPASLPLVVIGGAVGGIGGALIDEKRKNDAYIKGIKAGYNEVASEYEKKLIIIKNREIEDLKILDHKILKKDSNLDLKISILLEKREYLKFLKQELNKKDSIITDFSIETPLDETVIIRATLTSACKYLDNDINREFIKGKAKGRDNAKKEYEYKINQLIEYYNKLKEERYKEIKSYNPLIYDTIQEIKLTENEIRKVEEKIRVNDLIMHIYNNIKYKLIEVELDNL